MMPVVAHPEPSETTIESLYQRYQAAIQRHLVRLVDDREAAEDLCQETFFKAMRGWAGRDPNASESAWLYRIATNTAYDYLRRRRAIHFTPLADTEPATEDERDALESRLDEQGPIRRALAQLPDIYRVPLVLHSCEGRNLQEIAVALGTNRNTVKTRLFRARERFRQVYQG